MFSSIPVERRNVRFKMDLRHCFLGFALCTPHLALRGLGHVVNMLALDQGLLLNKLEAEGPAEKH